MFIKERYPPLHLLTTDACISRLPEGHQKLGVLRQTAASYQKGFNGERKLDYYLRILDATFSILSDVTLSVFGNQFQMDSLIITEHAIYIIEVKSLDGTVTFHTDLKQLTQSSGENLIGRKYPITQAESISFHLLRWLQNQKLDGIPIHYFIAIADQSTVIQVNGNESSIAKVVSYADAIPDRLMKMNKTLSNTNIKSHTLKGKVIQTILKNCEELNINIIEKTGLNLADILTGVHCPSCNKLGMVRLRYKWHCQACDFYSRTAHKKSLIDFALIYGNEITSKQCQLFLGINRHTAYMILRSTTGITLHKNKRKWLLDIRKLFK